MKPLLALALTIGIVSLLVGAAGLGGAIWMAREPERWHRDLYRNVDALEARVSDLEFELSEVNDRADSLESSQGESEGRLDEVEPRLEAVETRVDNACAELEFQTDFRASC